MAIAYNNRSGFVMQSQPHRRVVRPDSGDPVKMSTKCVELLEKEAAQFDDAQYQQRLMGRVNDGSRMRGDDRTMEEYMQLFARNVENKMREMSSRFNEQFTMINVKYERDISELQNEVETLTERLDSLDHYAEEEEIPLAA